MPIPKQTLIQALITEQTCGDACWHAKEDICRCSCGGKNHGCLRTEDGDQPARTSKIKGMMYQLVAVSPSPEICECANDAWQPINDLYHTIIDTAIKTGICSHGDIYWAEGYRMKNLPAVIKTPSSGEIDRWPELSCWRNNSKWFKPTILWVRKDMLQLVPVVPKNK